MAIYLDLVMLLNFAVDFLLLVGTNRLCGYPMRPGRCAAAAAVGGLYAGACLLPGFAFLGDPLWRIVFLVSVVVIAYGVRKNALKRGAIFVAVIMAMEGIALNSRSNGYKGVVAAIALMLILYLACFNWHRDGKRFVTIKLVRANKTMELTGLLDTGNLLKDPLTGQRVLVAGSEAAEELLGLTEEELRNPIETMTRREGRGLQLIPFHSIGVQTGMMLAARLDEVIIEGEEYDRLVAFAPQRIGEGRMYQALVGGTL